MLIRSFHFSKKIFILLLTAIILISAFIAFFSFYPSFQPDFSSNEAVPEPSVDLEPKEVLEDDENGVSKKIIKWVDFKVTAEALSKTALLDISSHQNQEEVTFNWIELLAYLACKYGGDFKNFKSSDLDLLVSKLKKGSTIEDLTSSMKYYPYYFESYSAVLGGMIGNFSIEVAKEESSKTYESKYGLKAFLPIAKNYVFSHYDDFGNSRSYGFRRVHLGNDLMGRIGTPIVAVESGVIEHLGWNQYGGWRIGIRSFDSKRYYYYAHLRKNHPYPVGLKEGMTVMAGDVIGYLGMTGYSIKENVNNINVPHLHFGMQLIFDESQVDSPNEIWIDVYSIIEFLKQNCSEVYMSNKETKDYDRKVDFMDTLY